jgi:hypothetical protein
MCIALCAGSCHVYVNASIPKPKPVAPGVTPPWTLSPGQGGEWACSRMYILAVSGCAVGCIVFGHLSY